MRGDFDEDEDDDDAFENDEDADDAADLEDDDDWLNDLLEDDRDDLDVGADEPLCAECGAGLYTELHDRRCAQAVDDTDDLTDVDHERSCDDMG
jgi:hypothetical protein